MRRGEANEPPLAVSNVKYSDTAALLVYRPSRPDQIRNGAMVRCVSSSILRRISPRAQIGP
jgi:hypothetical protein